MKVIFLDTEYNGYGELAQLAYVLVQNKGMACKNFFFSVPMDEAALRINKLSTEFLQANGTSGAAVRQGVLADFEGATLVAHNLDRDKRVLEAAFGVRPLPNRYGMCTMYRFARALKLPGGRPYKLPSLRELMAHYGIADEMVTEQTQSGFGIAVGAHDARYDAQAVRLCTLAAIANKDCRDLLNGEKNNANAMDR